MSSYIPHGSGGDQAIAITNSAAVQLTVPLGAQFADVICSVAYNYRSNAGLTGGVAPTSSTGMAIAAGQPMTFWGDQMTSIRFIAQSTSGTLNVEYGQSG